MTESRIAAQLFTLRDFLKTPADIADTLKKVRKIGYEAVQLSALGPIDPVELKKITDGEGLTICSTHIDFSEMRDNPQGVIEEHYLYECKHPAIGGIPDGYANEEGYRKFAREASEVARKLAEGGMTFSYHNHSFEFIKYGDKVGLEILRTESDPKLFNFEIDTYWVQRGGGDPADWIRKCKGRIPLLHMKDMGSKGWEPIMMEVGEGNLNWPNILAAAKESGVEWYLVEQDECQRDPFESLAISFRNVKAMGLR